MQLGGLVSRKGLLFMERGDHIYIQCTLGGVYSS